MAEIECQKLTFYQVQFFFTALIKIVIVADKGSEVHHSMHLVSSTIHIARCAHKINFCRI